MNGVAGWQVAGWDGKSAPELLTLERLDRDLFRNRLNQKNANDALFGGQVLALIFAEDGTLVASVAQEALLRPRKG
ncbi:MAG: hypothetical protein KGZ61_00350 [Sandarakinorhabdus sp.]|nr:hypothetical protein [Sandarakinorhabdus sp.]